MSFSLRVTLPTKAEALAYEAWIKTQANQAPEWAPAKRDTRRLSELVEIWYQHHGMGLRAGKNTFSRLKHLCNAMGDPVADRFTAEMFAEYRKQRMASGISANNLNREHAYLRSVFNELIRLKQWKGANPLSEVRQFKIAERELSFLDSEQIRMLLDALKDGRNPDALLVAKICLATGARWGEAEQMKPSQMHNGQIHFSGTKSGKNRSVPVDDSLLHEMEEHLSRRYQSGKKLANRCFMYSAGAFRKAVERAKLSLPRGQLTHVLRHTFASHFMMNGGNILALQKILGHSNLTMTMRYAHLAPEHLQEAKRLNPLARLTLG